MSAKTQKLEKILNNLENESEIFTCVLVSSKGQIMASGSKLKNLDENALAAMSAALLSVGSRVGKTLDCGDIMAIQINASGRIVIATLLASGVLMTVAPAESKVGLLEFEISKSVEQIKQVLG